MSTLRTSINLADAPPRKGGLLRRFPFRAGIDMGAVFAARSRRKNLLAWKQNHSLFRESFFPLRWEKGKKRGCS